MNNDLKLGQRLKDLRNQYGLTQQELADRTELTKGYISQLERDLTVPSVPTLLDILQCLGCSAADFFSTSKKSPVVYHKDDYFGKEDEENGNTIQWLITDSQKNIMEPVKLTLRVNGKTPLEKAHNGEEFGYVLKGQITLLLNDISYIIKEGESFYYPCTKKHQILNSGSIPATFLWVSAPPSF
ncbi:MAG TPA: helix-turn-helix domain-containing protein [Lachnospiraceae bacterium]|jgi:transcriptional regulator with XRE-family HTH domain|nr:helix-turn-helix domain-containing protein [Lachnospiraceae bacterium]HPF29010.1 helix-turn-helix domain-containing protein [Lachnospiraceae bacterium]